MISFKGILKYLIYIFLAGWMFFLGIMVGRGTSPVSFDTHKFQERLEAIAREHGGEKPSGAKKVDLDYYSALNHPIPTEGNPQAQKTAEIIPKKAKPAAIQETSDRVITSLKKATYKKSIVKEPSPVPVKPAQTTASVKTVTAPKKSAVSKTKKKVQKPAVNKKGIYTIQVAAYKDFKDAVTQMTQLEKKGFSSYRVKSEVDGVIWYRVRTGSFETYEQAKAYNEKLKKLRFKSMIIKKDTP